MKCPHGVEELAGTNGNPGVFPCWLCLVSPRQERISFLERKREATKADLLVKFEDGDWHGVADAAMDLRDADSELKGLRL